MSKKVSVRLPDEVAAKLDARVEKDGKLQSEVLVEAIARGLEVDPVEMPITIAGVQVSATPEAAAQLESSRLALVRVAQLAPTKCPKCGSATIPWGTGRRCRSCAENFLGG